MDYDRSTTKKICASLVSLCVSVPALAADQLTIAGGASLELHDNGPLAPEKESDLVRVANADIGYKRDQGVFNADLNYRAARRDYLHDTQSDENSINGNAALVWHIQPRRLDAVLYHQISQLQTDRQVADVSGNREERSIITAGFDGFLHFSPVDSLVLKPRFADINFQESTQSNSQRSTMTAGWNHLLDPRSSVDLTAGYDHVTFDEGDNDYNSPSVVLGYHAALSRLSYQAGIGYNRFNRDEGRDFNGSMYRLGFDYKSDSGTRAGGTFVHQLTDSSVGFSSLELSNSDFQSNDSNFERPSTVQKDQLDVYIDQQLNASNTVKFGAGYLKEDYKETDTNLVPANPSSNTTAQDQRIRYLQLGYLYTLNTFWSAGADARYTRTEFLDDPNNLRYNTTRLYVSLIYKPTRPMEFRLSVGRDKRDANVDSSSYTDKVATLGVNYRFY